MHATPEAMRNCTKLTTTSEQRVLNRQLDTRVTYSFDMSTDALSLYKQLHYLRDPAVSRDTFFKHLKTFLFAVY